MAADRDVSRLAVISNANSGRNREGVEAVGAVARACAIPHALTGEPGALPAVLRRFATAGVEVLAVNGGDGTLGAVIAALRAGRPFAREPAIALLRGGTTNMVHDDVGIRGEPARALARVSEACETGAAAAVSRPVIRVRRGEDGEAAFGFFFGTAAIPRAIRMSRRHMHARGLAGPVGDGLSLAWLVVRLLAGRVADHPVLHPDSVAWSLDGGPWQEESEVLLLVTTLERLLLGLRPVRPDGGLGVAGLTWPYRGLWWRLPVFLHGRDTDTGAGPWRARGHRLVLRGDVDYTLDGELFPADPEMPLSIEAVEPARFLVV